MQQRQRPEIPAVQEGVKQEAVGLQAIPRVTERPPASSRASKADIKTLAKEVERQCLLWDGAADFLHHTVAFANRQD